MSRTSIGALTVTKTVLWVFPYYINSIMDPKTQF